ncbi:MAG TPA: hypothetical protein VGG20_19905 [Thermoanaerobaculia bacterium]|jgi:hypothetical protein
MILSSRKTLLVSLAAALSLLPAAAQAQSAKPSQMILETEPGADGLTYCDSAHNLKTCASVHIETQLALAVGVRLKLDGEDFVVDWMGPGYYLENGLVLEPTGQLVADLKGQRWLEVYPDEGKVHASRGWRDKDLNRALSAADSLALDAGPELKVKDVRLHVRVSPVPAREKPAAEPGKD